MSNSLPQLTVLLLEALSLYILYVVVCLANRMTHATGAVTRILIVVVGVVAMWGFLRTITGDWPPTALSTAHIVAMVITAVYLLFHPRIPTGKSVRGAK